MSGMCAYAGKTVTTIPFNLKEKENIVFSAYNFRHYMMPIALLTNWHRGVMPVLTGAPR